MNTFKKLTVAAATAAAVGGFFSAPASAVMEGILGEAALIPFVFHGNIGSTSAAVAVNTFVALKVPQFAGIDTIPNLYTAPHTTPDTAQSTDFLRTCSGGAKDGHDCDDLRYFFFDAKSFERASGTLEVSSNDLLIFDASQRIPGNIPGYLVFVTLEGARGRDANFAFFAEAAMTFQEGGSFNDIFTLHVPAIPMSDGLDGGDTHPELGNEVIENGGIIDENLGLVTAVSPLAAGMRTANGDDGFATGKVHFNMTLGQRDATDNLLIVWLDDNYDGSGGKPDLSSTPIQVYDEEETQCDNQLRLNHELNLIWVDAFDFASGGPSNPVNLAGGDSTVQFPTTAHLGTSIKHLGGDDRIPDDSTAGFVCIPGGPQAQNLHGLTAGLTGVCASGGCWPTQQRGIVEFKMSETDDTTGLGRTEKGVFLGQAPSAGVAFSMVFDESAIDYNASVPSFNNGGGLDLGDGDLDFAASEHASDQGKQ